MSELDRKVEAAFDGYDGPDKMTEEALFWSMYQEGFTVATMKDCEYFYALDYPVGIEKRYAEYLKEQGV